MAGYSKSDLGDFFDSYVQTALWSSNDESTPSGGEPLDNNYGPEDLSQEAEDAMVADCKKFLDLAWPLIEQTSSVRGHDPVGAAGHDFWLTRNRSGAGFWDGDWDDEEDDKLGDKLTKIAQRFGEVNLYVGDDGLIYSD